MQRVREPGPRPSHKVEKLVDVCIDEAVAQPAEVRIEEYIPKSLRDSTNRQRGELDSIRVELYNVCIPCTYTFWPNPIIPMVIREATRQSSAGRTRNRPNEPFRQVLNETDTGSETPQSLSVGCWNPVVVSLPPHRLHQRTIESCRTDCEYGGIPWEE